MSQPMSDKEKDVPAVVIRPGHEFFTAVGELRNITEDDALMIRAYIVDVGELKPGETPRQAAQRKREKYRYDERYTSALD